MQKGPIVFRLDAFEAIGSGHAMRCMSIAAEVERQGAQALFAVSCNDSKAFFERFGIDAIVLDGDSRRLGVEDARKLLALCIKAQAASVLVDTYGATDIFFKELHILQPDSLSIGIIDDMYSFEHGQYAKPKFRPFDFVVNYDFRAMDKGYNETYSFPVGEKGAKTALFLGPRYAPIRPSFRDSRKTHVSEKVRRILITTGSTNPNGILEKMVEATLPCIDSLTMQIDVVVGPMATFSLNQHQHDKANIIVHENTSDLSGLMAKADVAISAGGSTLYELACAGVPTIAVPIVQNQMQNVAGFVSLGLGLSVKMDDLSPDELSIKLALLLADRETRERIHTTMIRMIDGSGASAIAKALIN